MPSQLPNFYFDVLANYIGHYNKNTQLKNTLKAQLIFSFQTQFLQFWLNFSNNKTHSKKHYLPHHSSENYEINSIKSDLSRAFQQHQEHPKFQNGFQFSFYLIRIQKMIQ